MIAWMTRPLNAPILTRMACLCLCVCAGVSDGIANDKDEANKLFVATVELLKQAAGEGPSKAVALYEKALRNLDRIVTTYPTTDLAVQISAGQPIGYVSRPAIERKLYEARRGFDASRSYGFAEGIRAALASYAADSPDNLFPVKQLITSYTTLRTVVNANGGNLPATEATAYMKFVSYDVQDIDNYHPYILILLALDIDGMPTAEMRITPEGVTRHRPSQWRQGPR